MEMIPMNRTITCFASVISEIQQSDIYLTVKARLFETPGANLNGVRVTPAFLSEIVEHQEKYVGLPLCADVKALADGNYNHLGHLYDARTGEFHSAQIGSFYKYEQEQMADGAALIGYARIMKRNKAVCHAISELFADGALKFSFEISCGSYRELDDGTIEIDASQDNFLEGAAVVSFPACERAVALDLVAECVKISDDGGGNMTDTEISSVAAEEEKVEIAQTEEEVAEAEETEKVEETAEAEEAENTDEVAEVIVTKSHYEQERTTAFDTETGASVEETVTVETTESVPQMAIAENNAEPDSEPQEEVASEEVDAACEKKPEDEKASVEEQEDKPENAYAEMLNKLVAELRDQLAALRTEVAELKSTPEKVAADISQVIAEANPFVSDMPMDTEKKYSLLESEEKPSSYSLLDRA